ncbi:MAG: hypothetical protein QG619_2116, partial [Pseudomonadota bacterium]|nr:hypothetical protein [Pseudomonadota bacterium]
MSKKNRTTVLEGKKVLIVGVANE